jgi:RHS repeat-associated protein
MNVPKAGSETTPLYLRYDAWNRMTGVDLDGDLNFIDANEVKYSYDARGMRIAKDFGAGSAQADQNYYFNEKWQVLEVRKDGITNPLETFAWQMGYIDAPLVRWHDANVDGDVSDAGDSTLYLLYDANYNVTAAVKILVIGQDYVPTVVERYHHTPYGLRTVLNADWSIDTDDPDGDGNYSDYNQTLAHQGGSIDFETGVIKFRHRDLHVSLGLWLERDPLGYVDGSNLCAYVSSRPTNLVDPFGLRQARELREAHPAAFEEFERLVQIANKFNETSPPWEWNKNECWDQARALRDCFRQKMPNRKYWAINNCGGSKPWPFGVFGYGLSRVNHNVCHIVARKEVNPLPDLVIDPYKGIMLPPGYFPVGASTYADFKEEYPHAPTKQ